MNDIFKRKIGSTSSWISWAYSSFKACYSFISNVKIRLFNEFYNSSIYDLILYESVRRPLTDCLLMGFPFSNLTTRSIHYVPPKRRPSAFALYNQNIRFSGFHSVQFTIFYSNSSNLTLFNAEVEPSRRPNPTVDT